MSARQKALAIHKKVATSIIEHLEKGVRPWNKPFKGGSSIGQINLPVSNVGRPYRGVNIFWLNLVRMSNGYEDNQWGTYKSWKAYGEKYAKSIGSDEYFGVTEKGPVEVIFWKHSQWKEEDEVTGEEKVRSAFHPRFFQVFNRAQTNLPPLPKEKVTKKEKELAVIGAEEEFSRMVEDLEIDFRESSRGSAYYSAGQDYIHLPERKLFKTAEGRAATAFHEAVHWTGHSSRLDRDLTGMFGSEDYAREELVAEMGSAMLCMAAGIEDKMMDEQMENHAAYLQSWLKAIKESKDGGVRFINSAATKAGRACELLMPEVFGKKDNKKEASE